MKRWEVIAELNMDASNVQSTIVKANTAKKAEAFARTRFTNNGAFFIIIKKITEINEGSKGE